MILYKDILEKYKFYLNTFEYPFIKQKNDYEIKKVFEKENRIFLLSWLVLKLLPSYSNKIEEAKNNNKIQDLLTNIIYENGFCRSSEKENFVKDTLDENKQIIIFNKIFSILYSLHSNNSVKDLSEAEQKLKQLFMKPTEELKNKLIPKENLFSKIQLPAKMSANERKNKIVSNLEQIATLKSILEQKEIETENISSENISSFINADDIENSIDKLKNCIEKFTNDEFVNFTLKETKTRAITLYNTEELEKKVETDSKEIANLLNNLQKRKKLQKFMSEEGNLLNDDSFSDEDDFSLSIRQHYIMSNKIIQEEIRNCID